jgi:hypothetical protein
MRYTRRCLLKAGLCLIPLAVFLPVNARSKNIRASNHLACQLARMFQHPDSVKVIGREYLRSWPEEANTEFLTQHIFSCKPDELLGYGALEPLREMISAQILRDFERHQVLAVRGWLFAQTELRLCALAAIV